MMGPTGLDARGSANMYWIPVDLLPKQITGPVGRLGTAAQNALEVARFGGLATDEEPSPYEVVSEQRVYRLRRYYAPAEERRTATARGNGTSPAANHGPPILLVPPMMLAAEVYDVSPTTSAVTILRQHGADPWVVDFGAPEREEGGLERTLADHVLAVSDAVDRVREATGQDVHLAGYSQGGMFCYQTAAYRRNEGLGSLITFGSPVDTRLAMPFGLPEQFAAGAAGVLADRVFRGMALPAWASRTGFRLLDPVKSMRSRIDFILQLHDREALLPREGQRRFLEAEGWVAWPGPAMADFLRQFIAHNRMLEGGFVIEGRLVTLADIASPILSVVGTVDQIAPAPGVRAIRLAAPRADVYELSLHAGHFGLVVGSTSNEVTWPNVAAWARWCAGDGELPERITPIEDDSEATLELAPPVRNRVGYGVELVGAVGSGMARSLLGASRADPPQRPRAHARGRGRASAPRPAGSDPAGDSDLAGPACRGARPPGTGRDLLPVRGPRLQRPGDQRADRQHRPRPDLDRRAPGRTRRRADGHSSDRARVDRRDQPTWRRRPS